MSSSFRSVTLPNITHARKAGSNSLESRDLRVLEHGCESEHARHVFAEVGEVVVGQAASERELALRAISGVG